MISPLIVWHGSYFWVRKLHVQQAGDLNTNCVTWILLLSPITDTINPAHLLSIGLEYDIVDPGHWQQATLSAWYNYEDSLLVIAFTADW